MTIGPAPMMRMDLRSVRLGIRGLLFLLFHHLGEAVEEITDVVRTRTRLRVPLKTKRWSIRARQALEGTVEERHVCRTQVARDRSGVDGEAVILAGDDDAPRVEVLHRMVRAVMPELHLHGLRARGEPHELVAEADAEHGQPRRVEDLADRLDRVVAGLRVARPVRQEYSIGLHPQDFARRGLCGDYGNARATLDQHPQDVVLDAVVAGDDL